MFGVNVTDYDRRVWEEELSDFLPDRITDIHVHIWKEGMDREGTDTRLRGRGSSALVYSDVPRKNGKAGAYGLAEL